MWQTIHCRSLPLSHSNKRPLSLGFITTTATLPSGLRKRWEEVDSVGELAILLAPGLNETLKSGRCSSTS